MFRAFAILLGLSVSLSALSAQTLPELGSFEHDGSTIWYQIKEGWAVAEGDILLGRADSIGKTKDTRAAAVPLNPNGTVPTWPGGEIYYTIDSNLPNQRRVTDAIAHWNAVTPIRLIPRTGQPNYVRFIRPEDEGLCASLLGMRGGEQVINLGDLCSTGNAIHEIGHAAGLLHEQDRLDRNRYVTVQYENLAKWQTPIYSQFLSTLDAGYYNYDSIMHYGPYSFTQNQRAVLLTVPLGIPIGVRANLSAGDIDTIQRLYGIRPTRTTVTTMPAGLEIEVDGEKYVSPQSFDWPVGSTHTVSVPALQTSTVTTRHRFVRWTDGGDLSHTFTASENVTVLAATFSREHRVFTEIFDGEGTVNVYPPSEDGYYPAGTKIRVNAIPTAGQKFLGWGTNLNLEAFDISFSAREFELDLFGNLLLGAFFTDAPVTTIDISPNDYSYVVVDGIPWTPPIRFDWDPGSSHTIEAAKTQYNDDGSMRYSFLNWADGSSAEEREVIAGSEDVAYTARYATEAGLVAAFTSGGRLFANQAGRDGYYIGGSTLRLRAVPNEDRDLIFWFGDINGRGKDRAMLMDQPRFATAIFGAPEQLFPFNAAHRRSSPLFDRAIAAVAPFQLVAIQVTGLQMRNPAEGAVVDGRIDTKLQGFRVLFDGVPAPIVRLAAPDEIVVAVPGAVSSRTSTLIEVERDGAAVASLRVSAIPTGPGIFTLDGSGYGPAVARNEDGTPNSPRNPARQGSVVALRVTGAGVMNRPLPDGSVEGAPGAAPRNPIFVRINGYPAEVLSAEPVAGEVNAILEVKVRVPQGLIPGDLTVQFIAGVWASPPYVTLSIR